MEPEANNNHRGVGRKHAALCGFLATTRLLFKILPYHSLYFAVY